MIWSPWRPSLGDKKAISDYNFFVNFEKPYDATCKYGIMSDLHNVGLKRRPLLFIKTFYLKENSQSMWDLIFLTCIK